MKNDLVFNMYQICRRLGADIARRFKASGYDFQPEHFMILIFLSRNGETNQKSISRGAFKSQATITRAIDKLVDNGLVVKKMDPEDRRNNQVRVTEKGKEVYSELQKIYLNREEEVLKGISQDDLDRTLLVLQKIIENI